MQHGLKWATAVCCSFSPQLGKWIEVGNSGMFRPEMLRPMGIPEDVNVCGWGLGLERYAYHTASVAAGCCACASHVTAECLQADHDPVWH